MARHRHEVQAPNLGNKAFYFVAWVSALYRVKLIGRPEGGAGHWPMLPNERSESQFFGAMRKFPDMELTSLEG